MPKHKTYPTIIASQARPLSTQLEIRIGERYTHPWQLKPTSIKNRYSLYKGNRKRFNVIFREEKPTPVSSKRLTARFEGSQRRRR